MMVGIRELVIIHTITIIIPHGIHIITITTIIIRPVQLFFLGRPGRPGFSLDGGDDPSLLAVAAVVIIAAIAIALLPGVVAATVATGYSGFKGVLLAKLKARQAYYERLLKRFASLAELPGTTEKIKEKFLHIARINREIEEKGFSPLLKGQRGTIKKSIRFALFKLPAPIEQPAPPTGYTKPLYEGEPGAKPVKVLPELPERYRPTAPPM